MIKNQSAPTTPVPAPQITTNATTSIPLISMVLGVVSMTMFIWFLGVPAIVLGIIGLKKYPQNRGYSITGLITGIISTLLMIGLVLFLFVAVAVGLFHEPESQMQPRYDDRYEQRDEYEYRYNGYDREGA